MNRRLIIIVLLVVALFIILFSFTIKKIASKRSGNVLRKTELKNKETLLNLAKQYETRADYVKARETLKEYRKNSISSADNKSIQSKIEDLNVKILFSDIITSDSVRYEIKKGDTLGKIASTFNTTIELIKKENNLKSDLIIPGRFLKVQNTRFNIVVNKTKNTLTLIGDKGEPVKTYTVSTGENLSTPTGKFRIEEKLQEPLWYKIGAVVEPTSPEYELGSRWMGLSVAGYGIHGTRDESTIGRHITKGCVRMKNADAEELYAIIPSGTEVTVIE